MKMHITITYNENTDITKVGVDKDFERLPRCTQLDIMKDALGLLAEKYEKMLDRETRHSAKWKAFNREDFTSENVVTLNGEQITIGAICT